LEDEECLTHPRRLETDSFAALTDRKLHRATDDAALGCAFRLALANEESSFGPEVIATFVADKAALVPLATNGGNDDVV
jgi:hypothetical protein